MTIKLKDNAADIRTELGIGTAALQDVGTGANNIVQLDSNAKIPAIDGSGLDFRKGLGRLHHAPAFFARLESNTNLASDTVHVLSSYMTVQLNIDNVTGASQSGGWNASNGRWTPGVTGKYFIFGQAHFDAGSGVLTAIWSQIRLNGTPFASTEINETSADANEQSAFVSHIVDITSTTDYLDFTGQAGTTSATSSRPFVERQNYFGGFKIAG